MYDRFFSTILSYFVLFLFFLSENRQQICIIIFCTDLKLLRAFDTLFCFLSRLLRFVFVVIVIVTQPHSLNVIEQLKNCRYIFALCIVSATIRLSQVGCRLQCEREYHQYNNVPTESQKSHTYLI